MSIVTTLLQKFGFVDSLRLKFASARLTVIRGFSVTHLGHVYHSWESTRLSERFQAETQQKRTLDAMRSRTNIAR